MVKHLVGDQGMGKTTLMVEWAMGDPDRVIVTFSEMEADRLREMDGLDPWQVVSVHHFIRDGLGPWGLEVGVDNADLVLASVLGLPPSLTTWTGPVVLLAGVSSI